MADLDQIRLWLSRWRDEKVSRAEFEDWFVPATWDVHKSGDQPLEELVDEIELRLSEYSDGYLPENKLREYMNILLDKSAPKVEQSYMLYSLNWEPAPVVRVRPRSSVQREHRLVASRV